MCVCVYLCVCMYLCVCIFVCVCIFMCVCIYMCVYVCIYVGSVKANGREPKSCLGRVFNIKLGCFTKCVQFMAYTNTTESRLAQVSS